MWDFSVSRAFVAVIRSWPFLLIKLALYACMAAGLLLLIALCAGIGYGVSLIFSDPGTRTIGVLAGGFVGLGIGRYFFRLLASYILYFVKAGHVAILLQLLEGRETPSAFSQVSTAGSIVRARFGEANVLFVLDQLIKAVLRTISGLLKRMARGIPIAGLEGLASLISGVLSVSLTFVDEVVLAYNIRSGVNQPWETSRRALVLYAQNGGRILKNAAWLALFIVVIGIIVFILALSPAAALVYWMPGQMAGWAFVAALATTWVFIAAIVEPFAIACLMQAYFKAIEGQEPDPKWDGYLEQASEQFREIKDRAVGAFGRNATPAG